MLYKLSLEKRLLVLSEPSYILLEYFTLSENISSIFVGAFSAAFRIIPRLQASDRNYS
jgi:hypothetical protein